MSLFYAIGDGLVSRDELVEKSLIGASKVFKKALTKEPSRAQLEFSSGIATAKNIITATAMNKRGQPVKPKDIGLGRPLTIEIRHVYPGKYPKSGVGTKKGMLITSAMKGIEVYNGMPRAINFLIKKAKAKMPIRYVDPTAIGTPLIFYSPAVTSLNSTLKIEIAVDDFPEKVFKTLSAVAKKASGIPIFAIASTSLFIAGEILNLAGILGNAIFDRGPKFEEIISVSFDRPGDFVTVADFRLLMDGKHKRELDNKYKVNNQGVLVSQENGTPYEGDYPYVVLCFDGRKRDGYKNFTPTAATADILESFYGSEDMQSMSFDVVINAMELYSDWEYRQLALQKNKEVLDLKQDDSNYAKNKKYLKKVRDAALKNIKKDELKPKFG